ncbi:hypothetical protein ACJJTC_019782 [Scirpophaga incertulas]
MDQKNSGKKFASVEQKLRLIQLLEADPQLKSGKFSNIFTKSEAKKRWINITEELNSLTGTKKTWEEWRKTWQDRKANAKKKFSNLRRQANLTGGGPPAGPSTLEDELIINSLDLESLVGHTDCQESPAIFIDTETSRTEELDSNSNHTAELDLSRPDTSKNVDGLANIDLTEPNIEPPDNNTAEISRKGTLTALCVSKVARVKRTVAQRRLQEGLKVTQTLNNHLNEKNEIKKKFYEEFINLMAMQTKALGDIAAALNNK